jgi:hypothetical protein
MVDDLAAEDATDSGISAEAERAEEAEQALESAIYSER